MRRVKVSFQFMGCGRANKGRKSRKLEAGSSTHLDYQLGSPQTPQFEHPEVHVEGRKVFSGAALSRHKTCPLIYGYSLSRPPGFELIKNLSFRSAPASHLFVCHWRRYWLLSIHRRSLTSLLGRSIDFQVLALLPFAAEGKMLKSNCGATRNRMKIDDRKCN